MWCRGIRGATTVTANARDEIVGATKELLARMISANDVKAEDVAAAWFTTSPDVNADFPARAAREMGWVEVPLLCGHEMSVPGGLARCVRIMLLVNTDKRAAEIVHIYLRDAQSLRPDIAAKPAARGKA